jgi:protein SCO1/2
LAAAPPNPPAGKTWTFPVRGVVRELKADGRTVVIQHEAIPGYMPAMTMPLKVKDSKELNGLHPGDEITFELRVTEEESWVEQVTWVGTGPLPTPSPPGVTPAEPSPVPPKRHPLMDYKFTNELGQAVSLGDFHGQALALTFFFTRCPIPEFCPRLSRNFEQASAKLAADPATPTNWHFLSISFDPTNDTPAVLKAYGERYHYDPRHWSFLTGPIDKLGELAKLSDVTFEPDSGFINHNFRTFVIDAAGRIQMVFPTSGDLSEALVEEMRKAVLATPGAVPAPTNRAPSTGKPAGAPSS